MIDILLPVYNGKKYLSQQLDSIIEQTYSDWRIIVRDDGSEDDSLKIIKEYANKLPLKFLIITDTFGNLGPTACLNKLLYHSSSDYFMFCDQDDLWEPNKIELSMQEMKRLEDGYPEMPILVCSDACCIDENDKLLCRSLFESQKFVDTTDDVHKMLALNIVQGATTMMNKIVKDIIYEMPQGLYHDWWVAVNVVYFGKVSYIHKPLLRYRQHRFNVVGALDVGPHYLLQKMSHVKRQMTIYVRMYKSLTFKPSIIKWVYYKFILNVHRL